MKKNDKKTIDLVNMRHDFAAFKDLAKNKDISQYDKIGFPDSYRDGFEHLIFNDKLSKLTNLTLDQRNVLDIGPGCSQLPQLLIH